MIKRFFFLTISLLTVYNVIGQSKKYFEGSITYRHDFKAKAPNVNDASLKRIFGSGATLFFKEGNYYHQYNGGEIEFDLYNRKENKFYLKKRNNDTIYWIDCSVAGERIRDFKFTAQKENVLGIVCDQMVVVYKNRTETHYYNADSIKINPQWFQNNKLNDEYLIDEKEKSVYLKSVHDFKSFTMIETAIQLSRQRVKDSLFKLPANAILVKKDQ